VRPVALVLTLGLLSVSSWAGLVASVEPGPAEPTPPSPVREITALRLDELILLDGALDEACWQSGLWLDDWLLLDGAGRKPSAQTRFKARFDAEAVYLGVIAEEPNMVGLREAWGPARDEPVYNDDCLEVWVDPANRRREAYHLIFSVAGGVWDGRQWETQALDPRAPLGAGPRSTRHEDKAWNGHAQAAFAREADRWTCEVRLPAADFGLSHLVEGSVWGLNLGRERWAAPGGAENSSLTGAFAWPMTAFAALGLGLPPVEVASLNLDSAGVGENEVRFDCRAPRRDLAALDVRLTARDSEERTVRFAVPLEADQPTPVSRAYHLAAAPQAAVTLELLRPESGDVLYRADIARDLSQPVRAYPQANTAFLGADPWTVDLELRIGATSLTRSRLRVEVLSPTGRVRQRRHLQDLRPVMRLNFRPRAIAPPGDWKLRFTVLDGKQELGRAEVPLRLLRPPV